MSKEKARKQGGYIIPIPGKPWVLWPEVDTLDEVREVMYWTGRILLERIERDALLKAIGTRQEIARAQRRDKERREQGSQGSGSNFTTQKP